MCVLLDDRANFDPRRVPIIGAPDIAAEVISPSERTGETRRKVLAYLSAGVREVWQIYPVTREVLISSARSRRELSSLEILRTDLLSGWSMPVASLFESLLSTSERHPAGRHGISDVLL